MTGRLPLLLVPGLLCDEALWIYQAEVLADSADVSIVNEHTLHDTIGQIAEALLAKAPPRFALAGLSMGGYIALEVVRQGMERIDRLALLDTSALTDSPEQSRRRKEQITLVKEGHFETIVDQLLPLYVHPDRLSDEELTEKVREMAYRVGPEAFLRQQKAIVSRADMLPFLPDISCPTLIICGRQDQLTPLDRSIEIADGIQGSNLVIIEECGHLSTMERPEEVSGVIRRWLREGIAV
jgi:pimeloyl-ACP methyl ester carboxylesterase